MKGNRKRSLLTLYDEGAALDWSSRDDEGGELRNQVDRMSILVKIAKKTKGKEIVDVYGEKDIADGQQEELGRGRTRKGDEKRSLLTVYDEGAAALDGNSRDDGGGGLSTQMDRVSEKNLVDVDSEKEIHDGQQEKLGTNRSSLLAGSREIATALQMIDAKETIETGKGKVVVDLSNSGEDMNDADMSATQMERCFKSRVKICKGKGKAVEGVSNRNDNTKDAAKIHSAIEHDRNGALPALRIGPETPVDPPSNRRVAEKNKDQRSKNLEIAQRSAAHFARFTDEKDKPTSFAAIAILGSKSDSAHWKNRFAEILAQVTVDVGRPDDVRQGPLPSPYGVAWQALEGIESTRPKPKCQLEWVPSRQPDFRKKRPIAKSLHDICIEVLCANIEFVETLVGLPDAAKKLIHYNCYPPFSKAVVRENVVFPIKIFR